MSSRGGRVRLEVDLEGRPHRGVTVRRQRLYRIVSARGEHRLTLAFEPGWRPIRSRFG